MASSKGSDQWRHYESYNKLVVSRDDKYNLFINEGFLKKLEPVSNISLDIKRNQTVIKPTVYVLPTILPGHQS